jgi:hypothetical protein
MANAWGQKISFPISISSNAFLIVASFMVMGLSLPRHSVYYV